MRAVSSLRSIQYLQPNSPHAKKKSIKSADRRQRPIVIGQACELITRLAGSPQSSWLGIEVILINSNPATIMTDPMMADKVTCGPSQLKALKRSWKKILNLIRCYLPWADKLLSTFVKRLMNGHLGKAQCEDDWGGCKGTLTPLKTGEIPPVDD
jgi:hypothetical protein